MSSDNEYESLEEALQNRETAQELYLQDPPEDEALRELPEEVGTLTALETLNVSEHLLDDLPPSLAGTPVSSLSIDNNCFRKIPDVVYKMPVERLNAERNAIVSLSPEIANMRTLRRLKLAYNDIESLPEETGNLLELEDLMLRDNSLGTLPASLKNLAKLETLDLCMNPLEELPEDIFSGMKGLTELNLSRTRLKKIPPGIAKLTSLERLDLSENSFLEAIPESIAGLSALKSLDLSGLNPDIIPEVVASMKLDNLSLPRNADEDDDEDEDYDDEDYEDEEEDDDDPGFNPAPTLAFIIEKIRAFAREHTEETFYAFALDSGLLCFSSEEGFEKTLARYQKDYPRKYLRKKDVRSLMFNTGDWDYQGFAESYSLDKKDWPGDFDLSTIDKSLADYKEYKRVIQEYLQEHKDKIFQDIRKTPDFVVFEAGHVY